MVDHRTTGGAMADQKDIRCSVYLALASQEPIRSLTHLDWRRAARRLSDWVSEMNESPGSLLSCRSVLSDRSTQCDGTRLCQSTQRPTSFLSTPLCAKRQQIFTLTFGPSLRKSWRYALLQWRTFGQVPVRPVSFSRWRLERP